MITEHFSRMPRLLRAAAFHVIGARNYTIRYGSEFKSHRHFIEVSEQYSDDERSSWRLERFRDLITNAVENTEYYRTRSDIYDSVFQAENLDEALSSVPTLEKKSFRDHSTHFLSKKYRTIATSSTSGTTGMPISVQHERRSLMRRFAFYHDHLSRSGIPSGAPSLRLSGRIISQSDDPRPYLYNPFEKQYFLSTYHLNEMNAQVISDFVHKVRPVFVDGYPSAIAQLVELVSQKGQLPDSLRFAVTTAETLDPNILERISGSSGIRVLDYYSASEGLPFIQMCSHGNYHVRWQSGLFEVERDGKFFQHGSGNLVVTSFVQDRMPLIRYVTGDWIDGLEANKDCPCGLRGEMVKGVLGRVEDLVTIRDGRRLGMFSYRTLKTIDGLGETQIIQNSLDSFTVLSTFKSEIDRPLLEKRIYDKFSNVVGHPVNLELRRVQSIPRGPNGKIRLVISKI